MDWLGQLKLISCEEVKDLEKKHDMSNRALTVKKVKNGYMTPYKWVQSTSLLNDVEEAWGVSYKELNNLEDVIIALQKLGHKTDEKKLMKRNALSYLMTFKHL